MVGCNFIIKRVIINDPCSAWGRGFGGATKQGHTRRSAGGGASAGGGVRLIGARAWGKVEGHKFLTENELWISQLAMPQHVYIYHAWFAAKT